LWRHVWWCGKRAKSIKFQLNDLRRFSLLFVRFLEFIFKYIFNEIQENYVDFVYFFSATSLQPHFTSSCKKNSQFSFFWVFFFAFSILDYEELFKNTDHKYTWFHQIHFFFGFFFEFENWINTTTRKNNHHHWYFCVRWQQLEIERKFPVSFICAIWPWLT
jgi:hypothetical protein